MSGELHKHTKIYNDDGSFNFGWSKKPLYDLNMETARFMRIKPFQRLRTKKWDYYYIFSRDFFFSVTLANMGYAGMAFAYFYDYDKNEIIEDSVMVPFGAKFSMARNSDAGRTCLENSKIKVRFDVEGSARRIMLEYPGFNNGEGLSADFSLTMQEGQESICVATPIEGGKMNYTHKICCMRAEGYIKRGDLKVNLRPEADLGGLDWSRGFLEYNTFWNWACSSWMQDGHSVGLNLCSGLNDTLDTENAFFIDGKCIKVDKVTFDFNRQDLMKPWKITSNDSKVNIEFIPQKERIARKNFGIIKSEIHQMFGRFTGRLAMDDGSIFTLSGIRGAIEDHHARW